MSKPKPRISFEFFPPKTEAGQANLLCAARRLRRFAPAFYSVTYGADGSTRERTLATVRRLREARMNAVPHLSWSGGDEAGVLGLLSAYQALGVDRIVALRGDAPPAGGGESPVRHAEDLVRLIRTQAAAPEILEVAAYPEVHPQAPSAAADIHYLKRKLDAGADSCITQYFYNADSYFYFRDRCAAAGIEAPIVPGVMPITNYANLARFSDKVGAELPRWMRKRLEELSEDQEALRAFGAEAVTALCRRLLDGEAPGLHFYTLNKAPPSEAIANGLGLALPACPSFSAAVLTGGAAAVKEPMGGTDQFAQKPRMP